MAIDPLSEETFPLIRARERLPRLRAGRPIAPSTLWRWATHGVRGVRLETVKIGSTTCTSAEALGRFIATLNNQPAPAQSTTEAKHDDQVDDELAERGY